jgi:hypothetical protein
MGRKLSPEEIAAEGLDKPQGKRLSAAELEAEGLASQAASAEPSIDDIATLPAAIVRGFSQGATGRFADEMAAAVEALPALAPGGETFTEARKAKLKEIRAKVAETEKQLPGPFMASEMAGSALMASRVPAFRGLGGALGMGALSGLGGSEAALDEKLGEALGDAAKGLGLGAAGYGVGKGLAWMASPVTNRLLPVLRRALERKAVTSGQKALLGGAGQLSSKNPPKPEAVLEALDTKMVPVGGSAAGNLSRLERQASERGELYDRMIDTLEKAGFSGPDTRATAAEMARRRAQEALVSFDEPADRVFSKVIEDLPGKASRSGRMGLSQAREMTGRLQSAANYDKTVSPEVNEARKAVASILLRAQESAVRTQGMMQPEGSVMGQLAEKFEPVKKGLALTMGALTPAKEAANREVARQSTGMFGKAIDAARMAPDASTMATAGALGALKELWRGRGHSTTAALARKLQLLPYETMVEDYLPAVARGAVPADDLEAAKREAILKYLRGNE